MQVVSAVVLRQEPRRLARIARHEVEVDNGVEVAAAKDPFVHGLAKYLRGWKRLGDDVVSPAGEITQEGKRSRSVRLIAGVLLMPTNPRLLPEPGRL